MGVHAGTEEVLVGADSDYAVVARWVDCVNRRLCRRPFYLYAVLAANEFVKSFLVIDAEAATI